MHILALRCIIVPLTNYAQGHEDVFVKVEVEFQAFLILTLDTGESSTSRPDHPVPICLKECLLNCTRRCQLSHSENTGSTLLRNLSQLSTTQGRNLKRSHDLINRGRETLKTSGPAFWNDFLSSVYVAVHNTFGICGAVLRK